MRVGEGLRDLNADIRNLFGGERPALEELAQGLALHVLHHDKLEVSLLPKLVNLRDMGFAERGSKTSFVEEHAAPLFIAGGIGR